MYQISIFMIIFLCFINWYYCQFCSQYLVTIHCTHISLYTVHIYNYTLYTYITHLLIYIEWSLIIISLKSLYDPTCLLLYLDTNMFNMVIELCGVVNYESLVYQFFLFFNNFITFVYRKCDVFIFLFPP